MSVVFLFFVGCGGGEPAPPPAAEAPKIELEDHMLTCMGDGDCTTVVTHCCPGTTMAVNKANAEALQKQATPTADCAAMTCPEIGVPAVSCKEAKCVLAH